MNKKYGWLMGALVITLLAVGIFSVTAVYADDGPGGPFGKRGGRGGGRGLQGDGLQAVAEVLGMSTDELSDALNEGKNLQELADEAGVDIQAVKDALSEIREANMRDRISQAVADGTMTQEKADWLLEGLDKGFLGDGPGFGRGRGGFGRPDGFQKPNGNPSPDAGISL